MNWRDRCLSWGIYIIIAQQILLIVTVVLGTSILLNLSLIAPLLNFLLAASWWLDLFGFLLIGIGFHAMGRFFNEDDDLKTQARTIGILIAFWSVPMFMFRASLQVLTTQKDYWAIIALGLGTWNYNLLGTPASAIRDGIYMLWVFSVWWPVLFIIHTMTGFGVLAIPFFLESVGKKLQISINTETKRFQFKHVKLFFIGTALLDVLLFVLAVLVFQPLIPTISSTISQVNVNMNNLTLLQQIAAKLQGLNLTLFMIILAAKQVSTAALAFLAWNQGIHIITSIQKQSYLSYQQKKREEDDKEKATLNAEEKEKQDHENSDKQSENQS